MALERRGGRTYLYRSVREGDKVRKVYVGAGELARIAHESDEMARELEAAERDAEREDLERLEALGAPVLEVCEVSEVLTRAHLIARGCHRHKGEWRRARRSA